MSETTLTIDGQTVTVPEGTMVLEAAKQAGIEIPTLCWMPRSTPWASCLVCSVQIEGSRRLVPSCATRAAEGMSVITKGELVEKQRKVALELLLSDHVGDCVAPCLTVCPGHLDIPGMNQAIAHGDMEEATEIVLDTIPLPSTLGRVCPAPCEARCRRKPLDGAVPVCALKQYVGDEELKSDYAFMPDIAPDTGKKVGIIGGGPAGFSAAYFLRRMGHAVTLYDERDALGGALRDIPEDRLPNEILDQEVLLIYRMEVEVQLGRRVELSEIRDKFDAVVIASGPLLEKIEGLDSDAKGIKAVKGTGATNLPGVFAAGASVAPGRIAIRSIGDGHAVARSIHTYLTGEKEPPGFSMTLETDRKSNTFAISRLKMADPSERKVEQEGLSLEDAKKQASRCLQCGCAAADDCVLRDLGSQYGANPTRYKGKPRVTEIDNSHSEVVLEPSKCIFCGICVRIAAEQGEASGLGYHGRGFGMSVEGPFGQPLAQALKTAARLCAEACPTGALYIREKPLDI